MSYTWQKEPPECADLPTAEEFYWVRGGNFNRLVIVRVNSGARRVPCMLTDCKDKNPLRYEAELNFTFLADNYPEYIWRNDLARWPGLKNLEWCGPIPQPAR